MKEYQALQEGFKSALQNSKLDLLHNVYSYNKKDYKGFKWLIEELEVYGMKIPQKNYLNLMEVQRELAKLDDINPLYIETVVERIRNNVGTPYWKNDKYASVRRLYKLVDELNKVTNNFEKIEWIKEYSPEIFVAITSDEIWTTRIHLHIDRLHTALHKYAKEKAILLGKKIGLNDSLPDVYEKIQNRVAENVLLTITDASFIKKMNDVRNKKSLAHPNSVEPISIETGLYLLRQFLLTANKIKYAVETTMKVNSST